MITIKDIAKSAGVSHTTVSRALRSDPRITPDTTERIVHIAEELGYVPNLIAQSLNAQRTYTIGMLVAFVTDPVVTEIMEGAEDVAQENGYCLFMSQSRNDLAREGNIIDTFQRRRVDGMIVVASRTESHYRTALEQAQVPLVLLDSVEVNAKHPAVNVDNIGGACLAVEHLLQMGHRRIGYIGAMDRRLTNLRRLAGYEQTLQNAGIAIDSAWITHPEAEDDLRRGQIGAEHCLAAGVSAIFCYNDQIAISVLSSCYHNGIVVPRDLGVVGYDDIRAANYVNPPLTTIRQPLHEMGRTAMEMVLNLIDKKHVANELLNCELVTRESVAPPLNKRD